MRIDLLPENGGLRFEIKTEPIDPAIFFPDREHGADVRTVRHPDWAGAHKWADRDWLESVEAELGEEVPLILTDADEVLEAGRANVFLVADGGIATPPADGRILPGTARAATLDLAADLGVPAAERPLYLDDLREADDLFLTSSLRGIRPVRSVDGEPLKRKDPLVERLAAELRRRWLDEGVES
jgi:para-aminobenzoate synthetase/4-amino-4-deoxychorismate lyase